MNGKILLCFSLLFAFSSCSTNPEAQPPKETPFRSFLKKFKPIKLPFYYDQNANENPKVESTDIKSSDTLFIRGDDKYLTEVLCYGILPDTSKYYGLIVMYPADALIPIL